jgi:hypothetical protein
MRSFQVLPNYSLVSRSRRRKAHFARCRQAMQASRPRLWGKSLRCAQLFALRQPCPVLLRTTLARLRVLAWRRPALRRICSGLRALVAARRPQREADLSYFCEQKTAPRLLDYNRPARGHVQAIKVLTRTRIDLPALPRNVFSWFAARRKLFLPLRHQLACGSMRQMARQRPSIL